MIFASDNWAGASERVLGALLKEARRKGPAYAGNPLSREVEAAFSQLFERDVAVFLVATGTAANGLALSAYSRPGGVVFCHRDGHVATDEGGAPEFLTGGARLVGLGGARAKLDPDELAAAVAEFPAAFVHHGQPVAVTISQISELGAVYSPAEVGKIAKVARANGLAFHMDGARFANAVATLGSAPADLTWRAGVDVLSFGATKNGCVGAEAVVFFDPSAARQFPFLRKRAGHLLSKSRLSAAQLLAYLAEGHWLDLARHANRMAARLADGIARAPGARLAFAPDANEVFAILQTATAARLRSAGAMFYDWSMKGLSEEERPGDDESLVRLVTSFATSEAEIGSFLALL